MQKPEILRLADYRRPEFTTDKVFLDFSIHADHTIVTSRVAYERTPEGKNSTELVLDAENPNPAGGRDYIASILMDGVPLTEGVDYFYDRDAHRLRIPVPPHWNGFELRIETRLEPQNNSELTGLYKSDSVIVTQCESQGFRRITPFLDRPDVMARYFVSVEADEKDFPVLLSNGNKINQTRLSGGRHRVMFADPWPKPSYLFCTANGKIEALEDVFVTRSGRRVKLRVFTEAGQTERGRHAMDSLKKAMKWDEDVFGCEYDLDDFNIVTVAKFTFGAMENKGLNVFRDSLILASPESATDGNFQNIVAVVGHEYFHNWSGNRITVANWFNVSLKEGLTVAREQMFAAFMTSKAKERIEAVMGLRMSQFPSDDGPLAHPVMPQEVRSVDNCYTSTIYEKGAEVLRMMKELMGEEKFIEGVKHYFKTHDGKAVTINEFVRSMEHVSGLDLSGQFFLWYTQSGRPRIKAAGSYDPVAKLYILTLDQTVPPTRDQSVKQPMHIPVRMGLVDAAGKAIPLVLSTDTPATRDSGAEERVLSLTEPRQIFVFRNVDREPAFHSLLRGFSAPADMDPGLSEDQLYKQLLTDPDGFNRWNAGQKLAMKEMNRLYAAYTQTGAMPALDGKYVEALRSILNDDTADPALTALFLTLPGIREFEASVAPASPAAISAVRRHIVLTLGSVLYKDMEAAFKRCHEGAPYSFDYESAGRRSLKGVAVSCMLAGGAGNDIKAAKSLYFSADNMTDRMAAMSALRNHFTPEREEVFADFYNRFSGDQLTVQKWFSMQAASENDQVISKIGEIVSGGVFNRENPGHVGALIGGFAGNYRQFHRPDGKGYEFLADCVLAIDKVNGMMASKLVESLCNWQKYVPAHQKMMIAQLERIAAAPSLSSHVGDKLSRSLPGDRRGGKPGPAPAPSA